MLVKYVSLDSVPAQILDLIKNMNPSNTVQTPISVRPTKIKIALYQNIPQFNSTTNETRSFNKLLLQSKQKKLSIQNRLKLLQNALALADALPFGNESAKAYVLNSMALFYSEMIGNQEQAYNHLFLSCETACKAGFATPKQIQIYHQLFISFSCTPDRMEPIAYMKNLHPDIQLYLNYLQGLDLYHKNEYTEAKDKFLTVSQKTPSWFTEFKSLHYYLAHIYSAEGDFKKANFHCLNCIEAFKNKQDTALAEIYLLLGCSYISLKQYKIAPKSLEIAFKLNTTVNSLNLLKSALFEIHQNHVKFIYENPSHDEFTFLIEFFHLFENVLHKIISTKPADEKNIRFLLIEIYRFEKHIGSHERDTVFEQFLQNCLSQPSMFSTKNRKEIQSLINLLEGGLPMRVSLFGTGFANDDKDIAAAIDSHDPASFHHALQSKYKWVTVSDAVKNALHARDYSKALKKAEELATWPTSVGLAHLYKGRIYSEQNNFLEAEKEFRLAIDSDFVEPNNKLSAYQFLSLTYHQDHQLELARETALEALRVLSPLNNPAKYMFNYILMLTYMHTTFIQEFAYYGLKCFELDKTALLKSNYETDHFQTLCVFTTLYFGLEKGQEVVEYFIAQHPSEYTETLEKNYISLVTKMFHQVVDPILTENELNSLTISHARKYFDKDYPLSSTVFKFVLIQCENYEEALEIEITEDKDRNDLLNGTCYYNLRQLDKALPIFLKLKNHEEFHVGVEEFLAYTFFLKGEFVKSHAYFSQFMSGLPDIQSSLKPCLNFSMLIMRYDKAISRAFETVMAAPNNEKNIIALKGSLLSFDPLLLDDETPISLNPGNLLLLPDVTQATYNGVVDHCLNLLNAIPKFINTQTLTFNLRTIASGIDELISFSSKKDCLDFPEDAFLACMELMHSILEHSLKILVDAERFDADKTHDLLALSTKIMETNPMFYDDLNIDNDILKTLNNAHKCSSYTLTNPEDPLQILKNQAGILAKCFKKSDMAIRFKEKADKNIIELTDLAFKSLHQCIKIIVGISEIIRKNKKALSLELLSRNRNLLTISNPRNPAPGPDALSNSNQPLTPSFSSLNETQRLPDAISQLCHIESHLSQLPLNSHRDELLRSIRVYIRSASKLELQSPPPPLYSIFIILKYTQQTIEKLLKYIISLNKGSRVPQVHDLNYLYLIVLTLPVLTKDPKLDTRNLSYLTRAYRNSLYTLDSNKDAYFSNIKGIFKELIENSIKFDSDNDKYIQAKTTLENIVILATYQLAKLTSQINIASNH